MTIGSFLDSASKQLLTAGIESARLDCLLLLEDALRLDRAHILAHPEAEILESTEVKLNKQIVQRGKNAPLAYIRGRAEFYGRDFTVSPDVLVPRPETESIINLVKNIKLPTRPTIADVGTGSGCIGISLALELPGGKVYLCDISSKALDVARKNAQKHNADVTLARQHLLASTPRQIDLVVANLPYVPLDLPINRAASFEPKLALFSGSDGLDLYREFWEQLSQLRPQNVITESLPAQHAELQNVAQKAGYRLVSTEGFAQHFSL